jgi:hypothetical protein
MMACSSKCASRTGACQPLQLCMTSFGLIGRFCMQVRHLSEHLTMLGLGQTLQLEKQDSPSDPTFDQYRVHDS